MNIGIIGNGGREHSICFKVKQSPLVKRIFCIPGNGGTSEISENIDINIDNFDKLYEVVLEKKIKLLIVGPEQPLVNGITDYFEKRNIMIFGPSKGASQLEGSKVFMKNFCQKYDIPTAKYLEIKSIEQAKKNLDNFNLPIVVKSDGLAAGKGVTICNDRITALKAIEEILNGKFKSSSKVILEEFLEGEEASYFVITDGKFGLQIGTAQDHKRIGENDTGPNTGGMGAYSPSFLISEDIEKKILEKIIEPTLVGMKDIGFPYRGILYAGLMIKNNEPKLIEYNIRFGDPECQILMMRLKSDLVEVIISSLNGTLKDKKIHWKNEHGITIVAASKGYPDKYEKFKEIKNINNFTNNDYRQIFHAGTIKKDGGKVYSAGGRVLNSTVISESLKKARAEALGILDNLDWENKYYRRDIGYKVIDK